MAASGAVRAESFEEGHAGFFVGRWYMILVSFPNFASLTELLTPRDPLEMMRRLSQAPRATDFMGLL